MAGKELYIQPILEDSLKSVKDMSEHMADIAAQFTESIRIQSNILASTGLSQKQEVFSQSTLSSLPIKSTPRAVNVIDDFGNDINPQGVLINVPVSQGKGPNLITFIAFEDMTEITVTYVKSASSSFSSPSKFTIEFCKQIMTYPVSGVTCTLNGFNIPKGTVVKCYYLEASSWGNVDVTITSNGKNVLKMSGLKFDTNHNIKTLNGVGGDGVIPIPSVDGVGTWSACLVNGDLTGVNLSIVDTSSGVKLIDLAGTITDISTLTQLSNFGLKADFVEGSENSYISAIIFRYF